MLTALTANSYKNVQLNAGVLVTGLDMSTYTTVETAKTAILALIGTDACLGATSGGGKFTAKPETRTIELDGARYGFVGDTVIDSWDGMLTTTVKELTANNIKQAFAAADATTSGNVTKVTVRTEIKDTDYIDTLVWIGDTGDGLMAIELKNALNTSGFDFTFKDKAEGEVAVEFHAHQDSVGTSDVAPFACYLLEN